MSYDVIKFSTQFTCGTGQGNDLIPDEVRLVDNADGNDTLLSPVFVSGLTGYRSVTELYLTPGFFYFGDREFYAFGNKYTEIVSGTVDTDGQRVLILDEFPDGAVPTATSSSNSLYSSFSSEIDGAAPVIVRSYGSGALSSLKAISGEIIGSETGIDGEIGYTYRLNESGQIDGTYSGEISDWPWYFSPLERFAKCYEYWRESGVLHSPDEYYYDFNRNRIILPYTADLSREYVIEFEGLNEPFPTGIDLNPLVAIPEDTIMCLSLDEEIERENVGRISVHSSRSVARGDRVYVTSELFSERDNRMQDEPVTFSVERVGLALDGEPVTHRVSGVPVYVGEDLSYDFMSVESGVLTEGGIVIADEYRVSGCVMVRSAGILATVEKSAGSFTRSYDYTVSGVTDMFGFSSVEYYAPDIVPYYHRSRIITDVVNTSGALESSGSVDIVLPVEVTHTETSSYGEFYYGTNAPYTAFDIATTVGYSEVSGDIVSTFGIERADVSESSVFIYVPSGCTSPSSIEAVTTATLLEELYTETPRSSVRPEGFVATSGALYAVFESGSVSDNASVIYLSELPVADLGGYSPYGSVC